MKPEITAEGKDLDALLEEALPIIGRNGTKEGASRALLFAFLNPGAELLRCQKSTLFLFRLNCRRIECRDRVPFGTIEAHFRRQAGIDE